MARAMGDLAAQNRFFSGPGNVWVIFLCLLVSEAAFGWYLDLFFLTDPSLFPCPPDSTALRCFGPRLQGVLRSYIFTRLSLGTLLPSNMDSFVLYIEVCMLQYVYGNSLCKRTANKHPWGLLLAAMAGTGVCLSERPPLLARLWFQNFASYVAWSVKMTPHAYT